MFDVTQTSPIVPMFSVNKLTAITEEPFDFRGLPRAGDIILE